MQVELVVSQTKLPRQGDAADAEQLPVPLQCETGVKLEPVQDAAAPQVTPVPAWVQALAPLQVPVLPQGGAAVHWPAGAG